MWNVATLTDGPMQLGPMSRTNVVLVPQMPGAHWWTGSQAVENPSVDSVLEPQEPWKRTGHVNSS